MILKYQHHSVSNDSYVTLGDIWDKLDKSPQVTNTRLMQELIQWTLKIDRVLACSRNRCVSAHDG